jgi:hypothetical protein
MHDLQRFLVDYEMAMLRALARNRGVTLTTNRQTEAVDQLAAALLEQLSVRVALDRLSPQASEALEALLMAGGRMRAPRFGRRFGQVRPIGPGRLERDAPWQDPANPAEELWYAGLIFRAFSQDPGGPGEYVFVPNDLLPLLPQPEATPPAFAVETVCAPVQGQEDGQTLVRDLFSYLIYVQNHDVRPYADGRLGRRDLAALRRQLEDADERRFVFLRHLADRLRFVGRQGEFLRLETAPVKRWLTASTARQLLMLQEAWRDDPTWNDLCQVPGLICDPESGWHLRYDAVAMRRALLALLARCPLEAWWTAVSFVAAVKAFHPDFQRPDGDYSSWYIRDSASGSYVSGFESWDRVEGALITDLLAGPLRWIGVVATEAAQPGAVCRLTEAGGRFLGLLPEAVETPPSPPIAIQPDFRVEVPAPASLYVRFQLERFADLEGEEPCRYRLTVGALGRALARDVRVEQVLAFLQQASQRPVPPNVTGQLRMWAGRFGQVQLEEVALLRVKNERVLKELSVLPETRALIARVLSPTTALVRKEDFSRLQKALRDLGYLSSPPGRTADDAAEAG